MKFWNVLPEENILRIDGEIASESWWGDEVTPREFREDLNRIQGDVTVFISSPGGDVVAASEIYTALKEHKGHVTVMIDGVAASAASVIAMAGDTVRMAPTAYLMIHRAGTVAWGNVDDMDEAARQLREIDDGIILAYQTRSHLSRDELLNLMKQESWLNAASALEYGLIDEIAYRNEEKEGGKTEPVKNEIRHGVIYAAANRNALYERIFSAQKTPEPQKPKGADARVRALFALEMQLIQADDA
ncbi:MAG: Clp protease ClpP [Clostridia bacterium]|nr:Clp protease ClpP [Clostridia bacterium]